MKLVHLLRHAKSSWADPDQPDRERPLAPRGRRAAHRVAAHLRRQGVHADLVLCSPAVRAVQTLEPVSAALGDDVEVLVEDKLYGATALELLARLRRLPEVVTSVMVVGHNPGLQDAAVLLAGEGELRERVRAHFPTGALATLALRRGAWADLQPAGARLVSYVAPRGLS